ncbi:MAG: hypothetical protein WEB30_00310 [Cyclobacteriaceae bacterium]
MKNVMLTSALVLVAALAFGQSLKKGNLVGLHVATINLSPDVTMNQYKDFFVNSAIPEYKKHYGAEIYLAKGIRGENINSFAFIFVFESEKMRDKYFNADGSANDVGKAVSEKMQPTMDKLNKLGASTSKYTDWVVQ